MISCSPTAYSSRTTFFQAQDLELLVNGVASAQVPAMQTLYQLMAVTIGPYLDRTVGSDAARDRLHEAYLDVATALQRGELRKPETLRSYIWAFARAHAAREVNVQVKVRKLQPLDEAVPSATLTSKDLGPEIQYYKHEQTQVVKEALDC